MAEKQRIAVIFGGRSPEHDVSIVTGLQVLRAVDSGRFEAFPVYVTPQGEWLVGEPLAEQANYLPSADLRQRLTTVIPDVTARGKGVLAPRERKVFRPAPPVTFDVALLAFHGTTGEDGQVQGLFETAGVPYTGMRTLASAVLMDKAITKRMLNGLGIAMLPQVVIPKPRQGLIVERAALEALVRDVAFPAVVKPNHLGSSIGVAKVTSVDELAAVLPQIFRLDTSAVLEAFVPNLVEYNIAVSRFGDVLRTSAIERPKSAAELLDFKQKYLPKGVSKTGTKVPGQSSEGMLSLTREINPNLPPETEAKIRRWAEQAFAAVGGTGAPRIDFLSDGKTGEVWLNEVNPCPGSFGFFLWEAAREPMLFTKLLTNLIEEAIAQNERGQMPNDPTLEEARLFKRT
jgi:D-alanine-D-alanine ligase